MATGVLPVFIGKATRIIEYSGKPGDHEAKIYRCRMKLGIETDTQDIWGPPLEGDNGSMAAQSEIILRDTGEIVRVLKSFEGHGLQRPPMYSAIKVGGRKLYEYARGGVTVPEGAIKERHVYIKHIHVNHIIAESNEVEFDVHCSKGVYMRTLCADAGRLLGCGAVMSGLRRLKSDGFLIEDAISPDTLQAHKEPESMLPLLLGIDTPLGWMPSVKLSENLAEKFIFGQEVDISSIVHSAFNSTFNSTINQELIRTPLHNNDKTLQNRFDEMFRVYSEEGFIGIGRLTDGSLLKPVKVLA
jgi:tRNA pseudouridine55 synthase